MRWKGLVVLGIGWFALFASAQEVHRLGPEDVIRITVTGYEQLSVSRATVSSLGTVTLPYLGDIRVQGLTAAEVEKLLSKMLERYLKGKPLVQVSVLEVNSRKVRVLGAVKMPGEYKLEPGATLVDVLTAAGDVTEDADIGAIQIISADGTRRQVDLRNYFRTGDTSAIPLLKANDTVRVPRRRTINGVPAPLDAADTTGIVINVWGNVAKPGQYVFYGTPTLLEVLSRAGGVHDELALERVQVIRGDPQVGGQITVNMRRFLETGAYDLLPALQSGDTVYVPGTRRVDQLRKKEVIVLGEVNDPGSYPIDGPVPLADALALAGGPTREADLRRVRITREQNGILQHRDVDVRRLLQGSANTVEPGMPLIRPGDTVFVPTKKNGLLSAANVSRGLIAFLVDMVALYGLYQALTK